MINKLNLALLSSSMLMGSTLYPRHSIADLFDDIEQEMVQAHKRMRDMMSQFDQNLGSQRVTHWKPDIKIDGDMVIMTLELPGKLHDNGMISEASGNALRGAISCDGAKVKFSISDGLFLNYSVSTSKAEKVGQEERQIASEFAEIITLPEPVGNLENVQPEIKDQTVILRLPKAKNWKKLKVVK